MRGTPEEVADVWDHMLGDPDRRGQNCGLKEGIAGIGAAGSGGDQPVIEVEFWESTSGEQRERVLAEVRASPVLRRVTPVPG